MLLLRSVRSHCHHDRYMYCSSTATSQFIQARGFPRSNRATSTILCTAFWLLTTFTRTYFDLLRFQHLVKTLCRAALASWVSTICLARARSQSAILLPHNFAAGELYKRRHQHEAPFQPVSVSLRLFDDPQNNLPDAMLQRRRTCSTTVCA